MFKEENRKWWYMIGLVLIMGLFLLFSRDILIPVLLGQRQLDFSPDYIYVNEPEIRIDTSRSYEALFLTSMGDFRVLLFDDYAQRNVNSFVFLAREGFYNSNEIFRVENGILFQSGDRNVLNDIPEDDGRGGSGYFLPNEVNFSSLKLTNQRIKELNNEGYATNPGVISKPLKRYSLAIANTAMDRGSSQFFILTTDDSRIINKMQGKYTVIGEVISGTAVVQRISRVDTNLNFGYNSPIQTIKINNVSIIEN